MMVLVIKIKDGEEESEVTIDVGNWRVMPAEIRLVAAAMKQSLARACAGCVSIGLDTLMQEYGKIQIKKRKEEFRAFLGEL